MDADRFRSSPIGSVVRISGQDARLGYFKHVAFVPAPLPTTVTLPPRTYKLISEAERAVGRLDASVSRLPNPSLLVRPALRKEALSTSALEGTYATLSDVLEGYYVEDSRRSGPVREVLNYVEAAEAGLEMIKERPISLNLISLLQKLLVRGTRGDGYDAGRLRDRQVYIGNPALGIEQSRFVPPPHGDVLRDGVSD